MFHNKKFYLTLLFGSILAMFFVSPVSANNNEFQNGSIVTLGDSITQGWNGNQVVSEPYPIILGKLLNTAVDNQFSIGGAKIDGKENKDLPDTINTFIKSSSFEKTKVVVLAYGINDLNYSTQSLRNIIISLKQSISNLHQANPDIKIYAILPHQSFILPTQNTVGSARFSENDLLDKMAQVYQSFGIPVMDWRSNPIITPENHLKTLGDSVHPTQKTYQVIAEQLATWMLENQPSTVIEEESHLDIDTLFKKGFQVDPHLNSTVYIDQNGAKKTGMWQLSNGTYYYSAIDTGSWITNNWVHANGETYYASDSGEIIQGVFPVNGVWYDFGKNSTYYVRGPLNGYIYSPSCSTTNGGWNWFENGIPYTGFR
ncbi:MAG: GDSL-type esterase/lipase family protein [Leuconostoc pseudomesenteroides]|uniref:SGNH/GDSL hydrolase family protein n=1 Tax=Leuconostoc pseudomesenteroides TaxID=33968 RepID=UPI0039EA3ECD